MGIVHRGIAITLAALTLASNALAAPVETVLYSFAGGSDGAVPISGVIAGEDGTLYGTTSAGGGQSCSNGNGCGTVFKLTSPTKRGGKWTQIVLYSFQGGSDGATPYWSTLIAGRDGTLYGTTSNGGGSSCYGSLGCGAVFELSPPKKKGGAWVENVLYRFEGGNDGAGPLGGMVLGKDGALYGTTQGGGAFGYGTVFELTPPASSGGPWVKTVLYSFQGETDGENPQGGLLAGTDGTLYGTTYGGGNSYGSVFKLTPPGGPGGTWTETVLIRFYGGPNGGYPLGTLITGKGGALYGTTESGGAFGNGTVFKLSPPAIGSASWTQTVLYSFRGGSDAGSPYGGLIANRFGALYGAGNHGGTSNKGAVFKLTPHASTNGTWTETILYSFTGGSDGYSPVGSLFAGPNRALYGTTAFGGGGSRNT